MIEFYGLLHIKHNLGIIVRKSVFGVSDQRRLKPDLGPNTLKIIQIHYSYFK